MGSHSTSMGSQIKISGLAFEDEPAMKVNMLANSLPLEGKIIHEKYAFPSFDGRDMLLSLKELALKPWNMKSSHKRLRNQILKVRKLLNARSAKRPQRKRKFNPYENDTELAASSFGLISREKYGNQNAKNQRRHGSSSISRSPLSKEKFGKQEHLDFPVRAEYCSLSRQDYSPLSDRTKHCGLSTQGTQGNVSLPALEDSCLYRQDYSHLSDSDESIKGRKPMKQWNLKSHCIDLVAGSSCTHSTETSINDFDDSSRASNSLSSEKEDMELARPPKEILPSRLGRFPRLAIPIGPRFEAEVPRWEDATNARCYNRDDLKWLGTQIWPNPGITETNTKRIGTGRSGSCSCDIPGSVDCVRRHISEARKLLQSEIGTAFYSWRFGRMGEDVSKSLTLKEQKDFESLIKLNPLSDCADFWKLAMECFPTKSMKSMVRYYYNVYIPRRMSKETRSSFGALDSDTDQNENDKKYGGYSTTRTRIVPIFKLLKSRIKTTR